jgi:hypothetical protein
VFVLRDIEELSTQETAETLGLTLPAVQARLHRARLQLRATLGPILSCRQRSSELRVDDDLRIRVARAVYGHDHAKVCHCPAEADPHHRGQGTRHRLQRRGQQDG